MYIGKNIIVVNIQTRFIIIYRNKKKIDIFSVVYLFYIICIIPFHRRFNIKKIILISLFSFVLLTSLYYISFSRRETTTITNNERKHSRASSSFVFLNAKELFSLFFICYAKSLRFLVVILLLLS